MQITVQLTIQDLYRMLRHIKLGQNRFLDLVYFTFVLFFASLALVVFNLSPTNPGSLFLLFPALLYFFIYPKKLTSEAKRLFRSKPSFSQPIHYELKPEALFTKSAAGEESIAWDRFTRMMESKNDYIFYLAPTKAFSIPKRVFSPDEDKQFQFLLGQYMHPNKVFRN